MPPVNEAELGGNKMTKVPRPSSHMAKREPLNALYSGHMAKREPLNALYSGHMARREPLNALYSSL